MGVILASNFKMYRCTTWTEGETHGGAVNTSAEIVSGTDQGIFDDVSDAERTSGDTEYRKVYIRNENADAVNLKCWIEANYAAANQKVWIALGTASDVQTDADDYTYYQPTAIDHANVIDMGQLGANGSKAIWLKRIVTAAGNGYTADQFQLKVGMY